MIEYLLEYHLGRNVSSIIIGYITDPPVLPFLDELYGETLYVFYDTCTYWSYDNFYIEIIDNRYFKGKLKIRYDRYDKWCVRTW
jgi:hypothetical protein